MEISLRSSLTAAVATISAGAIAFAPVVVPDSVSARAGAATSQVAVELLAARESASSALLVFGNPGRPFPTAPSREALADAIDALYLAIEPWVEYAVDVAAYIASWIIPYFGWIINNQVDVLYNFFESLVHSGVFNTTDWIRGEGSVLKNVADWIVDAGLALVWLGIDELGAWGPLPPLPYYPPRPPYADVPEGVFGDAVVALSNAVARLSNGIWDIWEPIKGGVDRLVEAASGILDSIARIPFVPLINFELNATWDLIAGEGDAITGFAHDLINAGDQFIVDTIHGDGLIAATGTAISTTLNSISTRGGQAVQALGDWGRAQIDYLVDLVTPGSANATARRLTTAKAAAGDSIKTVGNSRRAMGNTTTRATGSTPKVPGRSHPGVKDTDSSGADKNSAHLGARPDGPAKKTGSSAR